MNKDKVYLEGYVVGHAADTLSYKGLLVQLGNSEIVEIDKDLVHKNINEPQPIKLKDVIARIGEFNLATKAVWINGILNELGSDYGTFKYKDGYEQGKLEATLEREKVTVPQYVADWIERERKSGGDLEDLFDDIVCEQKHLEWFREEENMNLVARAWLDGYEVEEEKRYYVRFKGMESGDFNYLNFIKFQHAWVLSSIKLDKKFRTEHTKKQLEEAGFNWVFDCEGIEIEEVEE